MDILTIVGLVAAAFLLIGATVIIRAVRREGWRRRVLSWLSVLGGSVLVAAGALLGVAVYMDLQPSDLAPTAEELARPVTGVGYSLLEGGTGELREHRGQVVLVNLWATWCAPCLAEMPYLQRLQETYGDDGLVVVTLSNESLETIQPFADRLPSGTINGYHPGAESLPEPFRRAFRTLPTTFLLDADGMIQDHFVGSRSYEAFAARVEPLLMATN